VNRHLAFGFILLFLAGCAPDISETDFFSQHPDPNATTGQEVILVDHSANGARLLITSEGQLGWGFNALSVQESDGVSNLDVSLVYETATQAWFSPLGSVISDSEAVVYAVPPQEGDGSWVLQVTAQPGIDLRIPVDVEEDIWVRPEDEFDLLVAWVAPTAPTTGGDTFEVALYRIENRTFVPITNAGLDLYPYMDMGGGEGHSTPYTAPSHVGEGRYRGNVNFIMSGGWDMTVNITLDGQTRHVVFRGFTVN